MSFFSAMSFESHRAMFESYTRNKYTSTGVIQWMLNNAWPEMIWHLYDYYLTPSSTYFAAKRSCQALLIMYSYNDNSIWLVNSLYQPFNASSPLVASLKVFFVNSTIYSSTQVTLPSVIIPSDSSTQLSLPFTPPSESVATTYFLSLSLSTIEKESSPLTSNFYWLSTLPDVLEWGYSSFYRTPCSSYADFTDLQNITVPTLTVSPFNLSVNFTTGESVANITLQNQTPFISFFTRLRISCLVCDIDPLPIIWNDNFFSILPGETKAVTGTFNIGSLTVENLYLVIERYSESEEEQLIFFPTSYKDL
jgi:exo-1,4-beta-D-glucosaminidase